jgi:hypothetical protein
MDPLAVLPCKQAFLGIRNGAMMLFMDPSARAHLWGSKTQARGLM